MQLTAPAHVHSVLLLKANVLGTLRPPVWDSSKLQIKFLSIASFLKKADDFMLLTMADTTVDATRRLNVKKQTLDDAYAAPANFLEIDVINPITHGVGKKRYTDYEVRMRVRNMFHLCQAFFTLLFHIILQSISQVFHINSYYLIPIFFIFYI